jgi:hypothetical protein
MAGGKRYYNPLVLHDISFDPEVALTFSPTIANKILTSNFGDYNNYDFVGIKHHAVLMIANEITDKLCKLYPEESYKKLSKWAYNFSFEKVKNHYHARRAGKFSSTAKKVHTPHNRP